MPLLRHLEQLEVRDCGSIEALFNIYLDCVGETGEGSRSSSLRSIGIYQLENLREVWRIKGGENNSGLPIRVFQAVESISIYECKRFSYLLTPTTTKFDLGALTSMVILNSGEIGRKYGLVESSQGHENTLFPAYLIHSIHNLRKLELVKYKGVEVIFEIKGSSKSQDNQHRILPYLENLYTNDLERLSHVWKCNWNEFVLLHTKQSESPFHNLTTIEMRNCHSIKYLFSPLMAELLSNLKKVKIKCLPNLKCIGGGGAKAGNNKISFNNTTTTTSFLDNSKFSEVDGVSWSLCQYPREISISKCNALSSVIPWYAAGQMQKLQVLKIKSCDGMKEVFETQWINKSVIMLELRNLKRLEIYSCEFLEHIFTFSTLESLEQLEELMIKNCKAMKVIVMKEEDDGEQKTKASFSKAVVFPLLKLIELVDLPELVGFFLGTNHAFIGLSYD
ncbi:unnamed protein product [Lactuca virosa]|uniref:Disease resistance protein At4g27190-like leucine-rich repeats domain-containing protein n=1 Tax=Lactuca virosa TaxID=75947 RepID=A0AAU9NDD2_9ASTR|nr:unnamed protein product [Lactuca virosa]